MIITKSVLSQPGKVISKAINARRADDGIILRRRGHDRRDIGRSAVNDNGAGRRRRRVVVKSGRVETGCS